MWGTGVELHGAMERAWCARLPPQWGRRGATSHNFSGLTAFMHVYNHVYNLYMTCLYMLHYVTPCDTACENSTNVSIQYHDDHELQIAFSQYFLHFFGVFLMLKVTLVMFGPNMSKLKGKLE